MESRNGTDYAQNYDLIVKLMGEALKGETLEVIGVQSGRIEEAFGFEPADIAVRTGRVDLMLRDENGAYWHIEEQRNLKKADMYRFAAYHFTGAKQWGAGLTDIILASGEVSFKDDALVTGSGRYAPMIIDFSERDGRRRLEEIRSAVEQGEFRNWLELVFLPLYGKETGKRRSAMVEEMLGFDIELFRAEKISDRLLAAAIVMSNKMVDQKFFEDNLEVLKMLDVIEVARKHGLEEGRKEGRRIGIEEGRRIGIEEAKRLGTLEPPRKMLLFLLFEKFGGLPSDLTERIRKISDLNLLEFFFNKAMECKSVQEFEQIMSRSE
ncbi:MAG: hypothetical protein D3916_12510 [Candidatus Electrothrix sp. MAN1_4]|nr:hypothetical protein [Candidatus Electrothrix sp. MAN1_4]